MQEEQSDWQKRIDPPISRLKPLPRAILQAKKTPRLGGVFSLQGKIWQVLDLLSDAGGLAGASAQVIEFCTTYITTTLDLDLGDRRAVGLEDTLNPFAV